MARRSTASNHPRRARAIFHPDHHCGATPTRAGEQTTGAGGSASAPSSPSRYNCRSSISESAQRLLPMTALGQSFSRNNTLRRGAIGSLHLAGKTVVSERHDATTRWTIADTYVASCAAVRIRVGIRLAHDRSQRQHVHAGRVNTFQLPGTDCSERKARFEV